MPCAGWRRGGHARHPMWTSCVSCWPMRSSCLGADSPPWMTFADDWKRRIHWIFFPTVGIERKFMIFVFSSYQFMSNWACTSRGGFCTLRETFSDWIGVDLFPQVPNCPILTTTLMESQVKFCPQNISGASWQSHNAALSLSPSDWFKNMNMHLIQHDAPTLDGEHTIASSWEGTVKIFDFKKGCK